MNQLRIYGLLKFVLIAFCFACTSRFHDANRKESVTEIENNLFQITKTGADTGTASSVLERMKALGVKGMSVAVFDQDKIIWSKGYGSRNKELNQTVNSSTVFQAASISKPVTSVASFRLVEKGLIDLNENINAYLERWRVPENEFTSESKVTLKGIVTHTAGISVRGFYGYERHDSIPNVIQILDGVRPANSKSVRVFMKPNTEEFYSGGGFTILQLTIEEITGKPFSDAMDELVLNPSGMKRSKFSLEIPEKMKTNFAVGYRSNGDVVNGGYHIYPEQAAAGLWTTPSDLAKFMLIIGKSYRKNKGILKQSTVKEMFKKIPGAGGMGFGIDGTGNSLRFRHSGGNEGYACYAVSFAENGRGVIVMTNSDNGTPLIREYLRAVSKEYNWPSMWPGE